MRATSLGGFAIALALTGAIIFGGVALTEINYVSGHPNAYGPAKVIAWGAGAGVLVSLSLAVLGWLVVRQLGDGQHRPRRDPGE